jgi:hypothetical protein
MKRQFAGLWVLSESDSSLSERVFELTGLACSNFYDHTESRARFEWAKKRPRYAWELSSEGHVSSPSISNHILWLFDQVRPGVVLDELTTRGYSVYVSCLWEVGARSVTVLSKDAIARLASHRIQVEIDVFSVDDDD